MRSPSRTSPVRSAWAALLALVACLFAGTAGAQPRDRFYHLGYQMIQVVDGQTDAIVADIPLKGFVREVEVFDQYRGKGVEPGRKSLALRIVMQDTDRTLTDSEVEAVMASLREQINEQFQAQPRT